MLKVSVVLPVFNASRSIARAVRSILNQSLREIELIVVDDGSTDETVARLRAIDDARLQIVEHAHRGVAAATNAAVERARAPILARMDADDYAHPERLARQYKLLHEQNLDVVGCQVRIVDESGEHVGGMQRYARWINEETADAEAIVALRFAEFPLVNPTILARRSYFELGNREGDFPEDYDLMLRAANRGMTFGKVGDVLFDWTDRPGRLTRTDARYTPAAFDRCRRTHLLGGPLAGVRVVDLWGVGQTGKPWLRWLQASDIAVRRSYDVNRRKIGKSIHHVPVLDPATMPEADGTPLVIAVGADGARKSISAQVLARGHVLGVDTWFVA